MEMKKSIVTAIILAAGSGSRMGSDVTKQRMNLCGESILYRSVKTFQNTPRIDHIVVVSRFDEIAWVREELSEFDKLYAIIPGGKTRAESVKCGLAAVPSDTDFIAVHDGARCLIKPDEIKAVFEKAFVYGAATACTSVTDTVKSVDDNGMISATLSRERLYLATTPQIFERNLFEKALSKVVSLEKITDDNMLIELSGGRVYPVDIGKENIKITTAEDLSYAEYLLRRHKMVETRIGHGYDVHRFSEGRKLVLGGVVIPHSHGLLGHSDADVLTHAIMDAILGACGLGDIGRHFPDTDEKYKGISSLKLLSAVSSLVRTEGFTIVNIDATVVMQSPKIAPYIDEMINNLSNILEIERGRINIKATTEEHLGFTGSGEGVCAHAVASVKK